MQPDLPNCRCAIAPAKPAPPPPTLVERFSFAGDDGHKVLATTCLKCGERIKSIGIENLGSTDVTDRRGRVTHRSPPTCYRVTLSCHGETETADRYSIEVEDWTADARGAW